MYKKTAIVGIVAYIIYFAAVLSFLITKTETALTIWELSTIIGGPLQLLVFLVLSDMLGIARLWESAMKIFMACCCALTGAAHIVNITVTRQLIREGVSVPEYFQIGFYPSVEMEIDSLAWGFFVGLAFFCIAFGMKEGNKFFKIMSVICGILCLAGFFGREFINENLWYLAPCGYGFGSIILCIKMLGNQEKEISE